MQRRITVADVNADIRSLTRPEELAEYALRLQRHQRMVEPVALRALGVLGPSAFAKSMAHAKEIARQAVTDSLTLLYNRRFFDEELQRRINAANKTGKPVSLILFDIDNFKSINDDFGHAIGDAVLRLLATILRSHTKIGDAACKYGGEELAVILNADRKEARDTAERLRHEIEATTTNMILKGKLFDEHLPKIDPEKRTSITVSAGVATYEGSTEQPSAAAIHLIEQADKALYVSKKKRGKNVVTAAEDVT